MHKYDKDTEYHHVAYHTLLCLSMLFRQGYYSNSEYKQRFKDQIELFEAYNGGGVLFSNSLGARERKIRLLEINTETVGDVEMAQILARGE